MSQIGLPFDWTGMGEGAGFIAGLSNAEAFSHIQAWQSWPIPISIISGPKRSGRTMLGIHFAGMSGGEVMDDAQSVADEVIFHAWNRALDSGVPLLIIADEPPSHWAVRLPDLRSRLAAAPHVRIGEPDEALMMEVIGTGLARAGSAFGADVPAWIAHRIERSYAQLAKVLDLLNSLSLSSGRKISVAYAKEALQFAGYLPILSKDSDTERSDKEL